MMENQSPFAKPMTKKQYEAEVAKNRDARMKWFADAKFGMFVHYGPYAVAGLQEWYMAVSDSGAEQYEREVTQRFHPQKGCAYEWAKLASEAGCKYMVFTTRHHDGYSMWDSDANPYNVVKDGHDYDVVAEFVDACREAFGPGVINARIKAGLAGEGTFYAAEKGVEVGSRPAHAGVSFSPWGDR